MNKDVVVQLFSTFEQAKRTDADTGMEFWLARELQELLGYAKWENFVKVVEKAKITCNSSGHNIIDHFPDIRKMINLGKGGKREIEDIALTRYACYLIAQNGDPLKTQIAFAQTYFAVQTRRMELIEQRLAEMERLDAREKLKLSEKQLSAIIYERLDDELSFGRIRSKGRRSPLRRQKHTGHERGSAFRTSGHLPIFSRQSRSRPRISRMKSPTSISSATAWPRNQP